MTQPRPMTGTFTSASRVTRLPSSRACLQMTPTGLPTTATHKRSWTLSAPTAPRLASTTPRALSSLSLGAIPPRRRAPSLPGTRSRAPSPARRAPTHTMATLAVSASCRSPRPSAPPTSWTPSLLTRRIPTASGSQLPGESAWHSPSVLSARATASSPPTLSSTIAPAALQEMAGTFTSASRVTWVPLLHRTVLPTACRRRMLRGSLLTLSSPTPSWTPSASLAPCPAASARRSISTTRPR
mmetsp:Transcript_41950/g.100972  ORF Transcript_41950/g.100972 Transcript_41950/m.100972 type:complete len:241 (+) Transcript_41950:142-864(+)